MIQSSFFAANLAVFVLWMTSAQAQSVTFEEGDWNSVVAKAKAAGKPIFVDTYASWCEPCKWMDKHVFAKSEVGDFFNQHYISYKLNIERGEGMAFAETYRVTAYPTLLYFSPEGELLHRIIGAYDGPTLIQKSKAALEPDHQIYTLQRRYEAGERDLDFIKSYTDALKAANEPYTAAATTYVETVGWDALQETEHFAFLEQYLSSSYSHPAYVHVLEQRSAFAQRLGAERVERYLELPFKLRCYELVDHAASKTRMREFLQDVKTLLPERLDYFKSRLEFYANRGDERKQHRLAQKYEKHCRDAESLIALARYTLDVYEGHPAQLNSALEWIDRALLLEERPDALETKARVLLALERRAEARTIAQRHLALCQDDPDCTQQANALLQRIDP